MLHSNQFEVNEAWIMFRLSDEPVHTEQDGNFHFFALMDAASCFMLASTSLPVEQEELTAQESKRLLKEGQAHLKRWPKTLFTIKEQPARLLSAEAGKLGISAVEIEETQLLPIISEAKNGFKKWFGQGA